MEALVISLLALAFLVAIGGLLVGASSRNRRAEPRLEPGSSPPNVDAASVPDPHEQAADPDQQPAQLGQQVDGQLVQRVGVDNVGGELTADQVAEIERALTGEELSAVGELDLRPSFRDRMGKARGLFSEYFGLIRNRPALDNATWDELEEVLLRADVGVGTSTALLDDLRARVKSEGIKTPVELVEALKADLKKQLAAGNRDLRFEPGVPNVWLFVGVNGAGKTTTIGKVGLRQSAMGRKVIMAAGDTFRAAAAEQLTVWAERAGAQIVRGQEGGDPGAVIFDAIERAGARGCDVVLADTAGRLHNKFNLMEELKKVRRISERPPALLTEVLLVIDATTGQNGLVQAKQFSEAVQCTGVVLTKLDGTAKGGIALAIQTELDLPIKLVGLGESAADLVDFDPAEFVDALFDER